MIIKDNEKEEEMVVIKVLPGSEIIPPNGIRNIDAIKTKAEATFLVVKEFILAKAKIVEGVNVTDPTSCNTAQQLAKDLNNSVKTIEEKRKEMKKPSLDEGNMIDAIAKLLTVPANKAIEICKTKIKTYDDDLVAKEKKATELNTPPLVDLFASPEQVPVVISESNVSKRIAWKFEITSICAIPKDWIILDEAKIKAFIKERKQDTFDGEIINGVKFIKDSSIILR